MSRSFSLTTASGIAATLLLAGCGADADAGLQGGQLEATATAEQGLGEPTCPFTPVDFDCGDVTNRPGEFCQSVTAPGYDHGPLCSHAHIVNGQYTQQRTGNSILAWYMGPNLTGSGFPCNAAWVRAIFWKYSGGTWAQVKDEIQYGMTWIDGTCFSRPVVEYKPTTIGVYKVALQAGVIYNYTQGTVQFWGHNW